MAMIRSRATWRDSLRLIPALLVVLAGLSLVQQERVLGIEGTGTPVDVRLTFGSGCQGSGVLRIFDPEGRPWVTDSTTSRAYRQQIDWTADTQVHITGRFGGSASPRLQLLTGEGSVVLAVELDDWGPPDQDDTYLVSCATTPYQALPNTAARTGEAHGGIPVWHAGLLLMALALGLFRWNWSARRRP